MLENAGLVSVAKGKEAMRRRERAGLPVYNGGMQGMGGMGGESMVLGGRRGRGGGRTRRGGVLQHYDEYEEDVDDLALHGGRKRALEGLRGNRKGGSKGMVLRADGRVEATGSDDSGSDSESDSGDNTGSKRRRVAVDASAGADQGRRREGRAVDFLTVEEAEAEELARLAKKKKKKDKKGNKQAKKMKKRRSKLHRRDPEAAYPAGADEQEDEDEDE